ncbi:hypothetical protein Tco_0214283 [Tanacetum coccineum]
MGYSDRINNSEWRCDSKIAGKNCPVNWLVMVCGVSLSPRCRRSPLPSSLVLSTLPRLLPNLTPNPGMASSNANVLVMAIEESKDLSSLALDELIGNLKVYEVVMEKDYEIYKGKKERIKSIALKAKKESGDDETSNSKSDDEEYVMAVRNFKNFLEERVNLFGNQEKKRSHSNKEIRRKERVAENVLDVVIQIISLVIVQNHLATKIKWLSLTTLGAIARITPKTKPTTKLVSWLNRQMR